VFQNILFLIYGHEKLLLGIRYTEITEMFAIVENIYYQIELRFVLFCWFEYFIDLIHLSVAVKIITLRN
jgi:hypothetical protein